MKLSTLPLRAIISSELYRLTNLPETFFLPVFLSTSSFSPPRSWLRTSQDWFGTVEDWFGGVACSAITPGAVKIESQNRHKAVIFIQTLLTWTSPQSRPRLLPQAQARRLRWLLG